jgi:hypothetical protein
VDGVDHPEAEPPRFFPSKGEYLQAPLAVPMNEQIQEVELGLGSVDGGDFAVEVDFGSARDCLQG